MRHRFAAPDSLMQPAGRGTADSAAAFASNFRATFFSSLSACLRALALNVTAYAILEPETLAHFGQRNGRLLGAALGLGDIPAILTRLPVNDRLHALIFPLRQKHEFPAHQFKCLRHRQSPFSTGNITSRRGG